jgi:hypothetical protein
VRVTALYTPTGGSEQTRTLAPTEIFAASH